ncbi:MAG TPA: 4Fe-4S dicluster domain-containing protein [Polyangiaceae bacterium]
MAADGRCSSDRLSRSRRRTMSVKSDPTKCNGCGDCVDACPSDALKVENEKIKVNENECSDCGACVDTSEKGALSLD